MRSARLRRDAAGLRRARAGDRLSQVPPATTPTPTSLRPCGSAASPRKRERERFLRSPSPACGGGWRAERAGWGSAHPSSIQRRAFLGGLLATLPVCAPAQSRQVATAFALPDLPGTPALRPLGGFEIDPEQLGFGGLSGLHIAPDLTVTAISDLGGFAEFALTLGPGLRPAALVLRRSGWLKDWAGRPLPRGHARDAEALARLPDGSWLVAFERWHRIWRYADLDAPARHFDAPPGVARAPRNAGLETLAVLQDGRWLAIAEDLPLPDAPGVTAAWLGRPGAWTPLGWRPGPGMNPVDATPLPDGDVLVLERGFTWIAGFWGRVVRLRAASLAAATAGAVLQGEPLLRLEPPLPVDNYEGIAALRHEGRTLVAVVSDDNQSWLQRTLLLFFELAE
ncbi:esterase-like activity of phytase family protein [Falsiroseomonas bella]|uniref:esterase-like activity of phytase family protein n=1 Tax=Falsiroseomonas bella TaxID=2184016 RepID=UPI00130497D1|nr:esterase-like activity of phytase family protein [Falsiroseomonas bella]